VAIIGSAPTVLQNQGHIIDGYDEIIRINNFKVKGIDLRRNNYDYRSKVGTRTDWHYSFYGSSIRTTKEELKGIKGHLCKCPNEEIVHLTEWHKKRRLEKGCGWAWIYRARSDFWQAPVYIPTKEHYLKCFHMLSNHVPTTGFSCIWEIINLPVKEIYITGFDFFKSGIHNVNDIWKPGKADDPIKHMPEEELRYLKKWAKEMPEITLDAHLRKLIK
jgi:hypothetical protein